MLPIICYSTNKQVTQACTAQRTMTKVKTFRFDATWIGAEGFESEILTIQAETLKEATAAAITEINGVNTMGGCLVDLQRLR